MKLDETYINDAARRKRALKLRADAAQNLISLTELTSVAGVNRSGLSSVLRGSRLASSDFLDRIETALAGIIAKRDALVTPMYVVTATAPKETKAKGPKMTKREAGRLGGLVAAHRLGPEGRRRRASKGGQSTLEKHGRGHFYRAALGRRKEETTPAKAS